MEKNDRVPNQGFGTVATSFFWVLLMVIWALPTGAVPAIRILPLGDSITSGCCNDTDVEGGYRTELYRLLVNAGYAVDYVGTLRDPHPPSALVDPDHEGHGGYQIQHVDAGIEGWLTAVADPDVILLLIGTNDHSDLANAPHAIDRLDSLIAHLAALRPYVKLIVGNLPRRTDKPMSDQVIQTEYNPHIPEIVARHAALGEEVSFVDLRACCSEPDDLASDGLHPSLQGFAHMAEAWFEAIANVISPLGTADPPAIMRVSGHVDLRHVIVTMSKPVEDSATDLKNFRLSGGVTVLDADLDASKRVLTLTTSSQSPSRAYSLTVTGVRDRTPQRNLIVPGSAESFDSSPVAEAVNYKLIYSLNLPNKANYNKTKIPYEVDQHNAVGGIRRVAYYLELRQGGRPMNYLWVSMDAFTADAGEIGVPCDATGAFFQQRAANMSVRSSLPGIITGDRLQGGNIEFWAGNYQPSNAAKIPNASDAGFDWGDTALTTSSGYGSMQVHNYAAGQTLFAFNGWGDSTGYAVDIGMGNASVAARDWTYAQNASGYSLKRLQVYALPDEEAGAIDILSSNPDKGVSVRIGPADKNRAGNGLTPFARVYAPGSVVSLSAPLVAPNGSTFQKWQKDGADFSLKPSISLKVNGRSTLTAVYRPAAVSGLTVRSANPESGVVINVSPADLTDAAAGTTPFSRTYGRGNIVSLEAARSPGGNPFRKWQKDGMDFSTNPNISVAMDGDHTMTAVYGSATSGTRTLLVTSGPDSGVAVTISPADVNREGNGVTSLTRSYAQGAILSVAVPRTVGTASFKKWQKDGADFSTNPNISLVMDRDHTLVAIYGAASSTTRILSVASASPDSGVTVSVSPSDLNRAGTGATPLTRSYAPGAIVSLEAPRTVGANTFKKWQKDGVDFSTNPGLSLVMDSDHRMVAIYGPTTVVTRRLTVNSLNPAAGVSITVNPADLDRAGNGVTPFGRTYKQGAIASLAAPPSVGSSAFKKWRKDGVDFSTNPNISVELEADHTLTAVY